MCGIAGVVHSNIEHAVNSVLIKRMCDSLEHRGPDDEGFYIEKNVGLGMRRLAIIDLPTGKQPITNEDGSIIVIFNGEIYNFLELREMLQNQNHVFKTKADTEVIVHLYEEYGERCVDKMRGMFGFALWDNRKRKLLLARIVGVKPLYYYIDNHKIVFGSEIKAILQDTSIHRQIDFGGINQLFEYGYTAAPITCFQNINELPIASTLIYQDRKVEIVKYWDVHFRTKKKYNEEISTNKLRSIIDESVKLRMISDVPLGAFLSGGIDSSLVVALMSKFSDNPIKTFSIGFSDPDYSELAFARLVADKYQTDHHEFNVKPNILEILPKLLYHHDIPFIDTSAIPTYYLCKMARDYVTVAISGDGGDETFAGYNIYLAMKAAEYYNKIPYVIHNRIVKPISSCIPETTHYINKGRVAREFLNGARLDPLRRFVRWSSYIKQETREKLYESKEIIKQEKAEQYKALLFKKNDTSILNRCMYVDIHGSLTSDMLLKVDRMSMASSLEVRSPLLDQNLFEFSSTLPDKAKVKGFTTKYLLRRLAADLLPKQLLNRPKRGFRVPLDKWLQNELADFVQDILFDPLTQQRGIFNKFFIQKIVRQHLKSQALWGREIWALIIFELWQRMYIDSNQILKQE